MKNQKPNSVTPKRTNPTGNMHSVSKIQNQNTVPKMQDSSRMNLNTRDPVQSQDSDSPCSREASHNTFALLADMENEEDENFVRPHKRTPMVPQDNKKEKEIGIYSQDDHDFGNNKEDSLEVEYNQTLAEHIKSINTKLGNTHSDSRWYLDSSDEDVNTPTDLIQDTPIITPNHESPSILGPTPRMKSLITRASNPNSKDAVNPSRQSKATHDSLSSSRSPRHRNRSRGRPRGAKSKR